MNTVRSYELCVLFGFGTALSRFALGRYLSDYCTGTEYTLAMARGEGNVSWLGTELYLTSQLYSRLFR